MKQVNNFDRIAIIYDSLSKLVFGNNIQKAQTAFISQIPFNSNILVLGGGTGNILKSLIKRSPQQITYLEASKRMLLRAKAQFPRESTALINFIHGNELHIPRDECYDVVITPFVLDVFRDDHLLKVMSRLNQALNENGVWLFTDFQGCNWYGRLLIKIMYRFFKMTSNIEADRLPMFNFHFQSVNKRPLEVQTFCNGLIVSVLYR